MIKYSYLLLGLYLSIGRLSAAPNSSAGDKDFYFPSTGVTVQKQAVLLAIDDYLLPLRENVGTYLSTPKYRKEPVVSPELPIKWPHIFTERLFTTTESIRCGIILSGSKSRAMLTMPI